MGFLDNSRASLQLCPEGAEEHYVYLIDNDQETSEAEIPLYNGLPFPPDEQKSDDLKTSDSSGASDKQNTKDKHSSYRK